MRFPFVLVAAVSAAGFAGCARSVRVAAPAPAPSAVLLDSAAMRPGRFDAGKMWTFASQAESGSARSASRPTARPRSSHHTGSS